jgi:hypothetical protein
MKTKMTLSVLFLSAACATPTLANYFFNPHAGIGLNIGSAPSPTPNDIRENRLPKVGHAAPPHANAVADDTTKNTNKPAMNDQSSAQISRGKNQSAGQMSLAVGGD